MSDFTNYIRVAIQGLPENSPMARAMAYEKARKAIRRQLEARSAKAGEIDATLDRLENAILDVEAEQSMIASQKGTAGLRPAPVSAGANVTPFNRKSAKADATQPAVHGGSSGGAANQALRVEAAGHDALNDFEMALSAVLSESSPANDWAGRAAAEMLEREDEPAPEEKPASAAPQIDIAALLRRAIGEEDMSDPANREAVYRRARTALDRYLKGLTTAPDYATVHSCIERLNDAIRDTENDLVAHAVIAETVDLNFDAEDLLTELEIGEASAARRTGANDYSRFGDAASAYRARSDAITAEVEEALRDMIGPDAAEPAATARPQPAARSVEPVQREASEYPASEAPAFNGLVQDETGATASHVAGRGRKRRTGRLIFATVAILCIGGLVAGAVVYPDKATRLAAGVVSYGSQFLPPSRDAQTASGIETETTPPTKASAGEEPQTSAASVAETAGPEKPGESGAVLAATAETAPVGAESQPAAQPVFPPINGEKAFLFETAAGSKKPAASGNVAWSVVETSPAPDQPPEASIHAEIAIPTDGLRATISLTRNLDKTLPATHLIEIIFDLSEGYQGGGIASVEGINFLNGAQGASDPMVGSIVKIAPNVFLFALSDLPAAVKKHRQMMSDPDMIEIPFVYYSGRRAALRLVAGSTGTEVFGEALQEWAQTADAVSAPQPILPEPAPPAPSDETPVAELAKPWKLKLPATIPVPIPRPL
ncbi:hypothetical protein [Oricola nitratireducens]|uniref:hypothetical protein n=1 Tax=Oricola nitratireducens TaxID=2775868 RepID=UPI001867BA28|nr:hypothetical protein [Oricola nitratireducens]